MKVFELLSVAGAAGFVLMGALNLEPAQGVEVAHYTFDDASALGADATGNYNGTPMGDASQTAGVVGEGALALDGDGDIVHVGGGAGFSALDDDGDGWSVTAWVQTSGNGGVQRVFSTYMPGGWNGGQGWGVGMRQDLGSPQLLSTTYGVVDMQQGTNVLDGNWHHVAYVFRNNAGSVATDYYVDGALESSAEPANGFGINDTADDFVIGALGLPTALQYFNGSIDDLRIFDNELSAGEVAAMVPEPMSVISLTVGLLGLLAIRRRGR
ncbi:MAG: LamG-like jellyroll fold domain-containing protein [Pirellulaceae bacterium]|nr:LamG domain-containing protein [Planctomycetales bacterium]